MPRRGLVRHGRVRLPMLGDASKRGMPTGPGLPARECVALPPSCSPQFPNGTCPQGEACVTGQCTAQMCSPQALNGTCQAGFACVMGQCVAATCQPNMGCQPGEFCPAGQCVPDPVRQCPVRGTAPLLPGRERGAAELTWRSAFRRRLARSRVSQRSASLGDPSACRRDHDLTVLIGVDVDEAGEAHRARVRVGQDVGKGRVGVGPREERGVVLGRGRRGPPRSARRRGASRTSNVRRPTSSRHSSTCSTGTHAGAETRTWTRTVPPRPGESRCRRACRSRVISTNGPELTVVSPARSASSTRAARSPRLAAACT